MFNDNLNVKVFPLDLRKGEQPFAASEDGSDTNSNERKASSVVQIRIAVWGHRGGPRWAALECFSDEDAERLAKEIANYKAPEQAEPLQVEVAGQNAVEQEETWHLFVPFERRDEPRRYDRDRRPEERRPEERRRDDRALSKVLESYRDERKTASHAERRSRSRYERRDDRRERYEGRGRDERRYEERRREEGRREEGRREDRRDERWQAGSAADDATPAAEVTKRGTSLARMAASVRRTGWGRLQMERTGAAASHAPDASRSRSDAARAEARAALAEAEFRARSAEELCMQKQKEALGASERLQKARSKKEEVKAELNKKISEAPDQSDL
eukprot:g26991.t1